MNYAYLEADAKKARYKPTAAVFGRGPVHILENDLAKHTMTRTVVRRPAGGRGKPPTIRDITARRGVGVGKRRRTSGPTLAEAGFTKGTITTGHPGVKRTTGPFRRGIALHGPASMKRWQSTFARKATEVKF